MSSPCLRWTLAASVVLLGATAADARTLRVCAASDDLPFSNRSGAGFENRVMAIVADELKADVEYTFAAPWRGYLRRTLKAGLCDVVPGIAVGVKGVRTTQPYYRSTYVFIRRAGEPTIASLDDPSLRYERIGVQLVGADGVNTPPVHALARRGINANVRGFMIYETGEDGQRANPIVTALASGDIDTAIVWGPTAGYFAAHRSPELKLTPVADSQPGDPPMSFAIALGVRPADAPLAAELDAALAKRKGEIDAVLHEFGVPLSGVEQQAGAP